MDTGRTAVALGVAALWLAGWGCASPPPWKWPPGLSNGSRVRVVAPRLGQAWQPGRVLLSTDGCWTIQAAVTHDPDAITTLTPRELSRLQLSRAIPPPDWWVVPENAEGWSEMLPSDLERAAAPTCGRGQRRTQRRRSSSQPAIVAAAPSIPRGIT